MELGRQVVRRTLGCGRRKGQALLRWSGLGAYVAVSHVGAVCAPEPCLLHGLPFGMNRVEIRPIHPGDLPAVLALFDQPDMDDGQTLSEPEARAVLDRIEGASGHRVFVAEAGGVIVGTFALVVVQHLSHRGARSAVVEDVVAGRPAGARGRAGDDALRGGASAGGRVLQVGAEQRPRPRRSALVLRTTWVRAARGQLPARARPGNGRVTRRCRPTLGVSVLGFDRPSAYPAVPLDAVPSAQCG